jgi:hypothetical protein
MQFRIHRTPALLLALAAAGVITPGCAHMPDESAADGVSGYYVGHWYGPNPEKPLGELTCTITPKGPDTWDAFFIATFGEVGEYEVPLEGKREDSKVVFGGDVDLGESEGGVFEWTGEIVGDTFNGNYKAATYVGTFRMKKTPLE